MRLYRDLDISALDPIAVRRTGFAENFEAALDATRAAELQISALVNLEAALSEREDAIGEITGKPYDEVARQFGQDAPIPGVAVDPNSGVARFDAFSAQPDPGRAAARREEIVDKIRESLPPQVRRRVGTLDQVRGRALEIAREAVADFQDVSARATGFGTAGGLGGGIVGAFTDPVNLMTLPLGAPGRASILATAAVEGTLNAGIEAASQPAVQRFKKRAGLEHGFDDALANIALAGAGGAVLGGSVRAGVKLLERAMRAAPDREIADAALAVRSDDPSVRGAAGAVDTLDQVLADDPGLGDAHLARTQQAMNAAADGRAAPMADVPGAAGPVDPDAALPGFEAATLKVDAARFQFKQGGDDDGVVASLRGVREWDRYRAGTVLVWEDAAGTRYIADGHQRHALAMRLKAGDPDRKIHLFGEVLRERDGVSADQAKLIAAAKNIAEHDGRPDLMVETAKVFRISPEALARDLPPQSPLVRGARDLAALDEQGFGYVVNELVDGNHAAIVGRLVPDARMQNAILDLLARLKPSNQAEADVIVRQALDAGGETRKQVDLFGEAFVTESLFAERAKVLSRALATLKSERKLFQGLARNRDTIEAAGNVLDQDANVRKAEIDAQATETLQTLAHRRGPLGDALTDAARHYRDNGRLSDAVGRFVAAVRDASARGDFEGSTIGAAPGAVDAPPPRGAAPGSRQDRLDPLAAEQKEIEGFAEPGGAEAQAQADALARSIDGADPEWPDGLGQQVFDFAREVVALPRKGGQRYERIGALTEGRAAQLRAVFEAEGDPAAAVDMTGSPFVLTEDEVRHILKGHGGDVEVARGQEPVTLEDFRRLPNGLRAGVIASARTYQLGKSIGKGGHFAIEYPSGNGRTIVIVAQMTGNQSARGRRLRIQTMFRRKGRPGSAPLEVRKKPLPKEHNVRNDPPASASDQNVEPARVEIKVEETEAGTQILIDGVDPVAEAASDVGAIEVAGRGQADIRDLEIAVGETGADGELVPVTRTAGDMLDEHADDADFLDQLERICKP